MLFTWSWWIISSSGSQQCIISGRINMFFFHWGKVCQKGSTAHNVDNNVGNVAKLQISWTPVGLFRSRMTMPSNPTDFWPLVLNCQKYHNYHISIPGPKLSMNSEPWWEEKNNLFLSHSWSALGISTKSNPRFADGWLGQTRNCVIGNPHLPHEKIGKKF